MHALERRQMPREIVVAADSDLDHDRGHRAPIQRTKTRAS